MSQSELVETLAALLQGARRGAADVDVAREIVTGLSAAGYEVVRTRPAQAEADSNAA